MGRLRSSLSPSSRDNYLFLLHSDLEVDEENHQFHMQNLELILENLHLADFDGMLDPEISEYLVLWFWKHLKQRWK